MDNYYFVHEYNGKTYYIQTSSITAEQKHRNTILYKSQFGIHKMLIQDEGGVTELTTNSVKRLNIKNDIIDKAQG